MTMEVTGLCPTAPACRVASAGGPWKPGRPSSRSGVFLNLEPLVGALLGVLVLGEAWGPGTVVGGTLIIGAALIVSRRSSV
jgi:hypothetical protein